LFEDKVLNDFKNKTMKTKPRVIKDLEAVDQSIINSIIQKYPMGFSKHLVSFTDLKGKIVLALPYETEDKSYMLKITKAKARAIMLRGEVTIAKEEEVFDIVENESDEEEVLEVEEIEVKESVED